MVHFVSHMLVSLLASKMLHFDTEQTQKFVSANLLDVDHLFNGVICDDNEEGGTFNNNFFHQNWPITLLIGTTINPYLGAGIALHFGLDYLDQKTTPKVPCDEVPTIPSIRYMLKEVGL